MGHFVSTPREREKRDRRDSRGDERKRQRNKNEWPKIAIRGDGKSPTKSPFLNLVYFNRYHHAGYRGTANATGYNEHS